MEKSMPKEILTGEFLGNTGEAWLIALFLAVVAVVGAKIAYWVFARVSRKLARRTKTALDDIVLDMIEEPIAIMFPKGWRPGSAMSSTS
jgi:positive regulator of sigma E activity